MSLAYTNQTIIFEIGPLTDITLVQLFYTIGEVMGWTNTPITNGFKFAISSPQGFLFYLSVWKSLDATYPGCVGFQLESVPRPTLGIPSGETGFIHYFKPYSQTVVWANLCSFFLAEYGASSLHSCAAVQGGSFYSSLPNAVGGWFSAGADGGAGLSGATNKRNFRSDYWLNRYSLCVHSDFLSGLQNVSVNENNDAMNGNAQLGILRFDTYMQLNDLNDNWKNGYLKDDGTPMRLDPLLLSNGAVVGELYDACLLSQPMAWEAPETMGDTQPDGSLVVSSWSNYMNYTHGFNDEATTHSLLLLQGVPAVVGGGNIAY